jgi:micrococcal nuclease
MLALAGGPVRNEGLHDAGPQAARSFEGAISFDDELVRGLEADALPATPSPCAPPALAIVTNVIDGDTVDVQRVSDSTVLRVRLIGVNAPEVAHDGMPAECHSSESTAFTAQLLGHPVWITYDAGCQDTFGRELAYLWVGTSQGDDGSSDMWNRQMLRRGLADTITIAPNDTFAATFSADRGAAEAAGTGLWSACP